MLAGDFAGMKLYRLPAQDKKLKKDGTPRDPKKIGKFHCPVFTSDGTQVVGFMLKMPDIAGMIKQPDRFVAYDAIAAGAEEIVVKEDRAAFDTAAAKRLGIDLDACLIWTGMDVRTVSGERVGYCADADFNLRTGKVNAFILTEGGASNALVGHREMSASMLKGYRDGAMIAQLGTPDMKLPIRYAFTWPNRAESPDEPLDLLRCGDLTFHAPDLDAFPCLRIARECAKTGGTACAIMNGANEEAVGLFLRREIGFNDIPRLIEDALSRVAVKYGPGLADILEADRLARAAVLNR